MDLDSKETLDLIDKWHEDKDTKLELWEYLGVSYEFYKGQVEMKQYRIVKVEGTRETHYEIEKDCLSFWEAVTFKEDTYQEHIKKESTRLSMRLAPLPLNFMKRTLKLKTIEEAREWITSRGQVMEQIAPKRTVVE